MSGINRDEWLAALAETGPFDDQSALSTREIAEILGLGLSAAKDRIRKLLAEGKAHVAQKRVLDGSGRPQWIQAYQLTPFKKKR